MTRMLNLDAMNVLTSSDALVDVADALLAQGRRVRFRAQGGSMHPTIRDGDALMLAPIQPIELRIRDIVLACQSGRPVAHRVVRLTKRNDRPVRVVLRGDALLSCDLPMVPDAIVGRVIAVERNGRRIDLDSRLPAAAYVAFAYAARAKRAAVSIARQIKASL